MRSTLRDTGDLLEESFEEDPAVIYLLDSNLCIVYCNLAWDRFAAENGGEGLERQHQLGRSVMDAIPLPLKQFFEEGYRTAISSHQPWEHCYECSSSTVYRTFQMVAYPNPKRPGLVVVNSIAVERLHDDQERTAVLPNGITYVNQHGIVTMCCHCRRACRVKQEGIWDWVPAYVEEPPKLVSHGICGVCMSLFYPTSA